MGTVGVFERTQVFPYICVAMRTETNTLTDVHISTNTDNSGKAKADDTDRQTRVGRKIHTPARLVQLVHAVVALNDIYTA